METDSMSLLNTDNAQNILNQFKELMQDLPAVENESFTPLNAYQAEKVIHAFKSLQLTKNHRKSFIEIMGLSHLENVSSKTLAFFLNSKEIHNFDDLVISALLNKLGKKLSYQIHTENIILEKKTDMGRIDIWVETNEYIIVIENKINHHANNNPFEDYVAHACSNNTKNKELIFVLLVLKAPDEVPENFQLITHFDLSKQILDLLGHKTLQADQYYLTYLIDYISAIEKLNPHSEYGKMQMDIVNFYRNNREILGKIQDENNKESVYQYYEQQVQEIVDLLQDQGLTIISDNAEFQRHDEDLSSIGGLIRSNTLSSTQNEIHIEFEIYKSTGFTSLWLHRFKNTKMRKPDSIDLQNFLNQEKISFVEQDSFFEVLLLDESESISAEDFVEKATPLIKQILTLHHIQS